MTDSAQTSSPAPLLLVAGAKGAVASTLAVAVTRLQHGDTDLAGYLTTADGFPLMAPLEDTRMAGWDLNPGALTRAVARHGVLPEHLWDAHRSELDRMAIVDPPPAEADAATQIDKVAADISAFRRQFPNTAAVLVNLLPACELHDLGGIQDLSQLISNFDPAAFPDMVYTLAAIKSGVPVVNFTPNKVEVPAVVKAAEQSGVALAGCDGKTGQTYFKVVLASALKARRLTVDGWYSLNILGNADGKNLMDPQRAAGKLSNKTDLLDHILGYPVGAAYAEPAHKVRIDYHPPRGDAKEAWDVIDIKGLFGLPMSLRLNLQGRDSILAAPMVLDLARWLTALQTHGRAGLVPELAFFFKNPAGDAPWVTFQEQITALDGLAAQLQVSPDTKESRA